MYACAGTGVSGVAYARQNTLATITSFASSVARDSRPWREFARRTVIINSALYSAHYTSWSADREV